MWPVLVTLIVGSIPEDRQVVPPEGREPEAVAWGTETCGALEGGVPHPCWGENFEAFTGLACRWSRNYLHPIVRDALLGALAEMGVRHPDRFWTYGDMSRPGGGPLGFSRAPGCTPPLAGVLQGGGLGASR